MDFAELQRLALGLERHIIPDLQRQIRDLQAQVQSQDLRIRVLENHTVRRFTTTLNSVPSGLPGIDVPVVWDRVLPAQDYTPIAQFQGGGGAIAVLQAGLLDGTKSDTGCTIRVVNTGAAVVPSVGLNVVAIRGR